MHTLELSLEALEETAAEVAFGSYANNSASVPLLKHTPSAFPVMNRS